MAVATFDRLAICKMDCAHLMGVHKGQLLVEQGVKGTK
jgi:hypothetical protein